MSAFGSGWAACGGRALQRPPLRFSARARMVLNEITPEIPDLQAFQTRALAHSVRNRLAHVRIT